ncbi:nucleoside/nucleotide kinase family protein [Salinisphaera sp. Q1T1-3]|uniref:nucleoside/nucleotide kinase family protein n=1 Tax=Salinisphaera sp. Q1T1-3 TaxID=2321229 RepID=UPI001F01B65D|nr:nucleoside/nucleotide kinase family protein [Salinisphaera sp. Q1T1-3]
MTYATDIALDAAVRAEASALADRPGRCVLGLVGAPASGKSTLAEALVAALAPRAVNVPMDGFHLSQRELHRLGRHDRKGAPDTFDAAGYRDLLTRIRQGFGGAETIYAPGFYREIEEPIAASIAVDAETPLVVTEGNYLLLDETPWTSIADALDAVWFLDVAAEQREAWLAARHQRFGRSRDAAWAWIAATDRPNAAHIEATAARADRHLVWDGQMLRFAA